MRLQAISVRFLDWLWFRYLDGGRSRVSAVGGRRTGPRRAGSRIGSDRSASEGETAVPDRRDRSSALERLESRPLSRCDVWTRTVAEVGPLVALSVHRPWPLYLAGQQTAVRILVLHSLRLAACVPPL